MRPTLDEIKVCIARLLEITFDDHTMTVHNGKKGTNCQSCIDIEGAYKLLRELQQPTAV